MMNAPFFSRRSACPCCANFNTRLLFSCPYTQSPVIDYLRLYYRNLDETPLAGAVYEAEQCTTCRACFQRYVPTAALLAKLYGEWLAPDDPEAVLAKTVASIHSHPRYSKAAHEFMALLARLKKRPEALRVFDFGMGWGEWLQVAKHHGAHVFGTELDSLRCQWAEQHGITVLRDDEWPTQRFDIIHTEQVFEHLPEPFDTLRRLSAALSDDGVIFVSVPRADRLPKLFADARKWRSDRPSAKPYHHVEPNRLYALQPLEHLSCFTPRSLQCLGERAGLVATPLSPWHRYAFFRHGGLYWKNPRWALKSLLRPIYETWRSDNQTVLFQKLSSSSAPTTHVLAAERREGE